MNKRYLLNLKKALLQEKKDILIFERKKNENPKKLVLRKY